MPKYANQKQFIIHRPQIDVNKDQPLIVSREQMYAAMTDLKNNGFKLWCYLANNKNGYEKDFSPADVIKHCGMSNNTVTTAVEELKAHHYLVARSNNYQFDFYIDATEGIEQEMENSNQINDNVPQIDGTIITFHNKIYDIAKLEDRLAYEAESKFWNQNK